MGIQGDSFRTIFARVFLADYRIQCFEIRKLSRTARNRSGWTYFRRIPISADS